LSDGPSVDPSGEAPPFLGSWRALYAVVLTNLVFWIGLMTLVTLAFR
jgi:hypothetical protein